MEKFITDVMGDFYFRGAYQGCTIIYGKRFQIESPDVLLKKFSDGKIGNVPEQSLISIYMEYIQTMYANDAYEMAKQLKILKLDVNPIYTAKELFEFGFNLKDIYRKNYFVQWVLRMDKDQLLFKPESDLIIERDLFINSNIEKYASLQTSSEPGAAVA